jgi:hypothetical protein
MRTLEILQIVQENAFTLFESLKASMVQNGARLAPFCTNFAFCGAERCGTEIYMPGGEWGVKIGEWIAERMHNRTSETTST